MRTKYANRKKRDERRNGRREIKVREPVFEPKKVDGLRGNEGSEYTMP